VTLRRCPRRVKQRGCHGLRGPFPRCRLSAKSDDGFGSAGCVERSRRIPGVGGTAGIVRHPKSPLRHLSAILAASIGPAIVQADSFALPFPQHRIAHSPWQPPFENPGARHAWVNAIALYLSSLSEAVGLERNAQEIRKVLDNCGMASRVRLAHPLVEIEIFLYRTGTGIEVFYQPGLDSPERKSPGYPGGRH